MIFNHLNEAGKIKGSRTAINNIFIDEPNEEVNKVLGSYIEKIESITQSYKNQFEEDQLNNNINL